MTFSPGKNIAICEDVVSWKGPLAFQTFNPDKPDKFGIKVFKLCDSNTPYCCELDFHTGKRQSSPRGATFDVVEGLIDPYFDCSRTFYFDNYYTSPILFYVSKGARDSGLWYHEDESPEGSCQGNVATKLPRR
ncbi:PiggyBac transposable element-derived protein 4-like [Plakobranchus ocellatus]|uniref:PiggyBac transposable element-derived protein 4-like n=1 Tax=Plakobranchus ocellatus TaxID=259542 RepID=A0AAV4CEH6_9GAST|nr:PiggyBac transposable element-derived protein 4-like [Plakobranchus ocellatus]